MVREVVRTESGQLAGAVASWAHEEGRPEIADAVAPREAIVAQKQATTDLGVGVRRTQRFLRHQLDGLVGFLSAAQPAFAQAYRDARVIVDRGTGHAVPDDDDEM